jgi:hypothetical protein
MRWRITPKHARMKFPARLIDFKYPSGTHHRRFLLSLGKPNSFLSVDVHAGESFTVVVVDGDLPGAMLAAFVVTEAGSLGDLGV